MDGALELAKALRSFDAEAFSKRHGGHKESPSKLSYEYLFDCPLCAGHNLRWNAAKGRWICWNCRASGGTVRLVEVLERIDMQDAVALVLGAYVGGNATLALTQFAAPPVAAPQHTTLSVLPRIAWPALCIDAREHAHVRAYLHGRGITDVLIEQWGLRAGVVGREKHHVIFPVIMDGGLVYWQARATFDPPTGIPPEAKRAWITANRYRKTLNPQNSFAGVPQATAGEVIFNYDRARTFQHVVICEGPVDAIKIGPHAVALLGKGTPAKLERLRRLPARRYTVYLDRGEEELRKAHEIAAGLTGYAPTYIAIPPPGYDPGSLSPEENANIIANAMPLAKSGLSSELRV
jgi:peptidoglycan/xylan/chitin deacetylase (PgdA/CDA1 family)